MTLRPRRAVLISFAAFKRVAKPVLAEVGIPHLGRACARGLSENGMRDPEAERS